MYRIYLAKGGHAKEHVAPDLQRVLSLVERKRIFAGVQFLEIEQVEEGRFLGAFLLWMSGDKALVRVDQHREHYASTPDKQYDRESFDVEFMGEDGVPFLPTDHLTVSRTQAWAALNVWLTAGDFTTALHWT